MSTTIVGRGFDDIVSGLGNTVINTGAGNSVIDLSAGTALERGHRNFWRWRQHLGRQWNGHHSGYGGAGRHHMGAESPSDLHQWQWFKHDLPRQWHRHDPRRHWWWHVHAGSGGNSALTAGSGKVNFYGEANGDVLTAAGSASDSLIAGAGSETLRGGSSTGSITPNRRQRQ